MDCLSFSYPDGYEAKCLESLETALSSIPAYLPWRLFDCGGDDVFKRFSSLPLLDKAQMRLHGPKGFLPESLDLDKALASGEVELVNTSGSTGDRVSNVWNQAWWNASERASWKLNSVASRVCSGLHREAILASPLCVGFPDEKGYLSQESRTLGRFLFLNERMDPSRWTGEHMRRMVAELNAYKPAIIEANPSYLAHLSRFISREGLKVSSPSLIVFTYENASALHRRQIQSAFGGAPLASSYGSTEAGYVFMECECGRFHQNVEFCHVDFIPFSEKHGGPLLGSLLATSFGNPWRSLLRFDIGDVARLASAPCPCGRKDGLTLEAIEGRAVNLTSTPSGRAVTQRQVDKALSLIPGLAEYQVVQTGLADYQALYAELPGFRVGPLEKSLREELASVYGGGAKIALSRVASLPPDPPGKYRLCKAQPEALAASFWERRAKPAELFVAN